MLLYKKVFVQKRTNGNTTVSIFNSWARELNRAHKYYLPLNDFILISIAFSNVFEGLSLAVCAWIKVVFTTTKNISVFRSNIFAYELFLLSIYFLVCSKDPLFIFLVRLFSFFSISLSNISLNFLLISLPKHMQCMHNNINLMLSACYRNIGYFHSHPTPSFEGRKPKYSKKQ